MASAPGFVPSGRKPQTVVNVNKNKTREKLRKLNLPQAFPSEAVVSAYLSPAVDTSEERFSWAVSNLVVSETLPWTSSGGTRARWISC